jgi:uncharacterized membrane protein
VDGDRLMALACKRELLVQVDALPGTFVREARAVLRLWSWHGGRSMDDGFLAAFILGVERTGTQDVGFFVEQLVELAVRAHRSVLVRHTTIIRSQATDAMTHRAQREAVDASYRPAMADLHPGADGTNTSDS